MPLHIRDLSNCGFNTCGGPGTNPQWDEEHLYTFILLRELRKLGLHSKDLDSSRENYGGGGWHISLPMGHTVPLGNG